MTLRRFNIIFLVAAVISFVLLSFLLNNTFFNGFFFLLICLGSVLSLGTSILGFARDRDHLREYVVSFILTAGWLFYVGAGFLACQQMAEDLPAFAMAILSRVMLVALLHS